MIQCSKCSREFDKQEKSALIVGSIMGNECIETLYFCDRCGVYTVEIFWDDFSGEESTSVEGPMSKVMGDEKVAMINRCSNPLNKRCRCAAHESYFEGHV